MHEIFIGEGSKSYRVYMENTMEKLPATLKECKIGNENKLFIITDENIYNIYKNKIQSIKQNIKAEVLCFSGGEQNKDIDTVQKIYDFLIKNNGDRNSILVALGGGIVGDLVGFVAYTYMRGIKYINIPTTLLSQVDSCIGGKVGFNYGNLKNIIGGFYSPDFVYISINFLKTLSKNEILNGLGEIIKYALISDGKLLNFLEGNSKQLMNLEHDKLLYIIKECLKIKNHFVSKDTLDLGLRNVLNFGHTIGHAIEIDSNYKVYHGVAVALGILVSIKLSELKFSLDKSIYNRVDNLYNKLGLPNNYKVDNYESFLYAINHDKKNANGFIKMVLLSDIGEYKIKVNVTEQEVMEALKLSINKEA